MPRKRISPITENTSDWSRFELRFEFYGPYSKMRLIEFYGWKTKLAMKILRLLNHGYWKTNGREIIGGFVSDPHNCGLYIGFYRRGTRCESLYDMYWKCVWEICEKIIFPAILNIGYNLYEDVSVFIAYSDLANHPIQINWRQIYGK